MNDKQKQNKQIGAAAELPVVKPATHVVPGQRWRSRDKRDDGLLVTVLSYSGPGGYVQIQRYRKSRVRTERFLKTYELVEL